MLLSLFDQIAEAIKPVTPEPPRPDNFEIELQGRRVPVTISVENRFNNRVSVNHHGILIRISSKQPLAEQRKQIDYFLQWAKNKLDDKPQLLDHLPQRKYVNGEMLRVGNHEFMINIFYHNLTKSSARIFKNNIIISLSKGLSKDAEDNTNSYLIAKCLCKYFQPIIAERLEMLNRRHFGKSIHSVKMKYATSYWGQCSNNGHITISLRLIFAPEKVIDYVLIHELAHLTYHDHSSRFWKLVERVMPDYNEAEKHLSENNFKYYL